MTVVVQPNVITPDQKAGVQVGEYSALHEHVALGKDGAEQVALREVQTVRIYAPTPNHYILDITVRMSCADKPVRLLEYRYVDVVRLAGHGFTVMAPEIYSRIEAPGVLGVHLVAHDDDLDTGEWSLRIDGMVAAERAWTWDEFGALPFETVPCDIHCVTKWSKLDTTWTGVAVDTLEDEWELRYFGDLRHGIYGDPDGDGLANAEEVADRGWSHSSASSPKGCIGSDHRTVSCIRVLSPTSVKACSWTHCP